MDRSTQKLIRRHNEQMRELIVRDIDALERKLDVRRQMSHLADGAVDKVKGTLGMTSDHRNEGWLGFVRHNAAPLAAVGFGGTVLAKNLRDRMDAVDVRATSTSSRPLATYAGDTPRDTTGSDMDGGGFVDGATSMASTATDKVGDLASSAGDGVQVARERVTDAGHAVVERIPSRDEAMHMAHDHSQLLGMAALGAGALIGTFLPRTRAEERKLAPVQQQVRSKASDLVEEGVEKARETAERASDALSAGAEAAKEAAKDEFSSSDEEPPGSDDESSTVLPDMTQPNRITGTRTGTPVQTGLGDGSSSF